MRVSPLLLAAAIASLASGPAYAQVPSGVFRLDCTPARSAGLLLNDGAWGEAPADYASDIGFSAMVDTDNGTLKVRSETMRLLPSENALVGTAVDAGHPGVVVTFVYLGDAEASSGPMTLTGTSPGSPSIGEPVALVHSVGTCTLHR